MTRWGFSKRNRRMRLGRKAGFFKAVRRREKREWIKSPLSVSPPCCFKRAERKKRVSPWGIPPLPIAFLSHSSWCREASISSSESPFSAHFSRVFWIFSKRAGALFSLHPLQSRVKGISLISVSSEESASLQRPERRSAFFKGEASVSMR